MSLEIASWIDILPALKENFKIWSPGLAKDKYQHYIWNQLKVPWSRKNLRYVILRNGQQLAASCKIYLLNLQTRGKIFSFLGIGALYTQEEFRGQGFAKRLIQSIIDYSRNQSIDGILLFSELAGNFYEPFGFQPLSNHEFVIYLPKHDRMTSDNNQQRTFKQGKTEFVTYQTLADCPEPNNPRRKTIDCRLSTGVDRALIEEMAKHYRRWLSRQPFGIERSDDYFAYKLGKERYIALYSKLNWPKLTITVANSGTDDFGYALTEYSGMNMRVLEVIGSSNAREKLWAELYRRALSLGMQQIRGWESVATDFAPGFSYQSICPDHQSANAHQDGFVSKIHAFTRDWGKPFIFPLNKTIADCPDIFPCPLLELDHL